MSNLPDVQNRLDNRGISLERVGLTNVKFPTSILRKDGTSSNISAKVKLFANLPEEAKGHNLSRFSEVLVEFGEVHQVLSSDTMLKLLERMQERLGSKDVYARFEFDYYINKEAPVSKKVAPQAFVCAFTGIKKNGDTHFILEVNVIAASLCPCSKEMSLLENLTEENLNEKYSNLTSPEFKLINKKVGMGAHNQRSLIKVELLLNDVLWIEDVIKFVEEQASAPTYPILKRPDERYVTILAYENPKFSEDIARDIQHAIESRTEVKEWMLKVENEESIHPFNVTVVQKSAGWKFN